MATYRVEEIQGRFEVVSDTTDGGVDVHCVYDAREEAQRDCDMSNEPFESEAAYWARFNSHTEWF